MAKYVLSRKAISDLTEIWQYTRVTWSEAKADKYYELLTGAFLSVAAHPDLGKRYEEVKPGLFGLRVGQHILFYRTTTKNTIQIIRILHIRMDLNHHLKD